jgi:hypothetical protein
VDAIKIGALEADDPAKAQILVQIYRTMRSSGGDDQRFVGGEPLPHTRAQIGALAELQRLPLEDSRQVILQIVQTFLTDFERLSAQQRRLSPLQALQAIVGKLMQSHVGDPAIAPAVRRFLESNATEEYAKWKLAVADLGIRLSGVSPDQDKTGARRTELIVDSFAAVDVVQIRQSGKRILACHRLLSEVMGDRAELLDQTLTTKADVTTAKRYFVAAVIGQYLYDKLKRGVALDAGDEKRINAVAEVWLQVRAEHGPGRFGSKPLERTVTKLVQHIPDDDLRKRVSEALEATGS